ncbi:MAG: hypothetical protein NC900_06265, partial [Candidatus Omnitrophica bacterium]|nr:hypothetical protein [Candidatus Omnitrophota bacterium]
MKKIIIFSFIISFILAINFSFSQTVEQLPKTQQDIEKERLLRERIEKETPKPEIEEEKPAPLPAPKAEKQKVLIKTITVVGATLLTEKEIKKITSSYENQELTLSQMQKIADLITDAYRKKGFITCRAYLPPQKIEANVLEIRVLEGITADIEVRGNKYFKSELYRQKINLKKGEPFNYEKIRKGLSKINQLPDRSAKAIIT